MRDNQSAFNWVPDVGDGFREARYRSRQEYSVRRLIASNESFFGGHMVKDREAVGIQKKEVGAAQVN